MNVVIVEGSITIRAQLQALLARERRIQVVGEAACEASAIETITRTQPDVVVMDLALQPGSGLRVLRAIRQLGIGARAIVLSNSYYEDMRRACAEHGISGFFDKSTQTAEVLTLLQGWLPPLRPDEPARQAAVDGLDLPPRGHSAFDELADLACDISGGAMAAVGLVDGEQLRLIGTSGLPLPVIQIQAPNVILKLQYIRLKASANTGFTYAPESTSTLAAASWTPMTGTETVESIDSEYERVTITDTTASGQTKRFAHIVVTGP